MLVAGAIFVSGVNYWLNNKSYVFQAEDIAKLTNEALAATKGTYSWAWFKNLSKTSSSVACTVKNSRCF